MSLSKKFIGKLLMAWTHTQTHGRDSGEDAGPWGGVTGLRRRGKLPSTASACIRGALDSWVAREEKRREGESVEGRYTSKMTGSKGLPS